MTDERFRYTEESMREWVAVALATFLALILLGVGLIVLALFVRIFAAIWP